MPLVINPLTGHISPQFYVVFNNAFNTVTSISNDDSPPSFWNEIDIDEFLYTIPLDNDSEVTLSDEWLTPQEREEKERSLVRATQLCSRIQPASISSTPL